MSGRQDLTLGPYAERITARLATMAASGVIGRIWAKDPSVWTADAAQHAAILDRLGWLGIPTVMQAKIGELQQFARDIRAEGFTHALLLGMGGSSLFPDVCRLTFGAPAGAVDVRILDSTDPAAVQAHAKLSAPKRTLAIVSSKSGTTSEVSALCNYFYTHFAAAGLKAGRHCVAVTDAGTPLERLAAERAFRRTFILGPSTGQDIGGRFSALSYFGLVPAALLGLDLAKFLDRGADMLGRCGSKAPLPENPAAQLAAVLAESAAAGRNKLTLLAAAPVAGLGAWIEQLVAESTGKQGQGIVPIDGEPLREPSRYGADRVFVELQLAGSVDERVSRQAAALAQLGHPVVRILWQDRYDLAGEAMKWCMATTIAGTLMGINPFDEPNVSETKTLTKTLLAEYARTKSLPVPAPAFTEGQAQVYGAVPGRPQTLVQALSAFLQQAKPADYLAVLSFLPRTVVGDDASRGVRARLAQALPNAVALETGPRYLHSTGQLYKGGHDTGLFLLLTAEEPADLSIPGEPFTFGTLKYAQALGDGQALQQKGRRILHVRLTGDPARAAAQLLSALDDALALAARR